MPKIKGIASHFDSGVRERGEDYFESGAVAIYAIQRDKVEADVHGSDMYEVLLERRKPESNEIEWKCSCPHFERGVACKHIWASLLYLSDFEPDWLRIHDPADGLPNEISPTTPSSAAPRGNHAPKADPPARPRRRQGEDSTSASSRQFGLAGALRPKMWRNMLSSCDSISPDELEFGDDPYDQKPSRSIVAFVLSVGESTLNQELVIEAYYRLNTADMESSPTDHGVIKKLNFSKYEAFDGFSREDRQLLNLLNRADIHTTAETFGFSGSSFAKFNDAIQVGYDVSDSVVSQLVSSGRFYWQLASGTLQENAVRLNSVERASWTFCPMIEANDADQKWTMRGCLQSEHGDKISMLPVDQLPLVLSNGIAVSDDKVLLFDNRGEPRAIDWFRRNGQVDIPYADQADLQLEIATHPIFHLIELPERLRWEETSGVPRGRLTIEPNPSRKSEVMINAEFVYDGQAIPANDTRVKLADWTNRSWIIRNFSDETEWIDRLRIDENALIEQLATHAQVKCPTDQFLPLTRFVLNQGWEVIAMGKMVRNHGEFNINVTSGLDWFDVNGDVEFDGNKISLPELLAKTDERGMIKLDDGSHGVLPEEWLDKIRHLAALGRIDEESIVFERTQGLWLDLLLAEKEDASCDRGVRRFRDKLKTFDGIKPASPPRGFRGELRDYQKEGLGWLKFLRDFGFGGCLADDMGLGKTVQVLALLHGRKSRRLKEGEQRKPSLVVVPKSLIHNWIDEAARFSPRLKIFDYTGVDRKRRWATAEKDGSVLLTTYGTLRRDIELLKDIEFDYAVLDEATAIKNQASQTAKCCRLLNADYRLALTGTPVENHLGELWSLFEYLNPGILGNCEAFDNLSRAAGDPDDQARWVGNALRPFILRRTKEQVLTELPDKTEMTLTLDLEPKQRKLYNELRDYYRALIQKRVQTEGLAKSKIHVLEALLRLRQVACHPGLVSQEHEHIKSAKLEALLEYIAEITAEGHKALIFSQFTKLLAFVQHEFAKRNLNYAYLDGKTRDRKQVVERFQNDDDCDLFLISLKAGGHGLNLTAADYVFILDPWWNPAVEAQAVDRAHRIGQTRNVFAYRFICQDTVEKRIVELQQSKRELADAILTQNNRVISKLSLSDIQLLLS